MCSDYGLRCYDCAQLLFCGQCTGHTDRVNDISACAGEGLVVSASDDGTARLWDLRTQAAAQRFGGPGSPPVYSACADEAGQTVATGGEGGVVQLWDLRQGTLRQAYYDLHTEDLCRVRFQPGAAGRLLTAAEDGLVSIVDVSVADIDDALVDCLSVGSAVDNFGFFGESSEDMGVWVCCSDQRFELWSLAPPPPEDAAPSGPPPRLMHFDDARPAVTELLRGFGGIGGGVEQRTAPPPAAAQAAAAAAPMQEDAAPEGGGEFAGAIAGPGMDALVEGEPDDENEAQYLVGCAFEGSSAAGGGAGAWGSLLMLAGHHDGRLSTLALTPGGASFSQHMSTGGHFATVRDMVLLPGGDLVTCGEDTSLCLWGRAAEPAAEGGAAGAAEQQPAASSRRQRFAPY